MNEGSLKARRGFKLFFRRRTPLGVYKLEPRLYEKRFRYRMDRDRAGSLHP